jgi:hypothetical protein
MPSRPRCTKCKGKLTEAQISVLRSLWRGGCHIGDRGVTPYCAKCFDALPKTHRSMQFKKYTHIGQRERDRQEAAA